MIENEKALFKSNENILNDIENDDGDRLETFSNISGSEISDLPDNASIDGLLLNSENKKIMFIPDVKIKIDQLKKTNRVCPISGWITSSKATLSVIKKESKYLI